MNNSDLHPVILVKSDQTATDSVEVSPLSLYTPDHELDIELRKPHSMPCYHWHSQIEVNIPFGGDVKYQFNGSPFTLKQGHIGLFWAAVPHRLVKTGDSKKMGIINIPIHLFLSWPISKDLMNQITHGVVLQSTSHSLVSEFEIARWEKEIREAGPGHQQLVTDEISLMLKRVSLDGWEQLAGSRSKKTIKQGLSSHAQAHVEQMLAFIAANHNMPLAIQDIADHVSLHANYAMSLFQRVMHMSIKQYITSMRIHHARALLSDTNRTVLDIALTVGFNSSSRFYATFLRCCGMTPGQYREKNREICSRPDSANRSSPKIHQGACDGQSLLVTAAI